MNRRYGTYLATALLAGATGWVAGLGTRGEDAPASSGSEAASASRPAHGPVEGAGVPRKRLTKSANRDDDERGKAASALYHRDGSVTFPEEWVERLSSSPYSSWDLKVRPKDLALLGVSPEQSEALQAMLDGLLEERMALEAKACKVISRKDGSVLLKLDAIQVGEAVEMRAMRQMEAILQDRAALVIPLMERHLGGLVSDVGPRVILREQVDERNAKYEEIHYDEARAAERDGELTVEDYRAIGLTTMVSHTSNAHPRLGHLFPREE